MMSYAALVLHEARLWGAIGMAGRSFFRGGVMDRNAKQRAVYSSRKAAGVCTICGRPLGKSGQLCATCRLNRRDTAKVSYERARGARRCTKCGAPLSARESTMCAVCNQHIKDLARIRYELRKSHGVCVICGKRRAKTGRSCCERCLAKKRAKYHGGSYGEL